LIAKIIPKVREKTFFIFKKGLSVNTGVEQDERKKNNHTIK
jgi:hypothetical protein